MMKRGEKFIKYKSPNELFEQATSNQPIELL